MTIDTQMAADELERRANSVELEIGESDPAPREDRATEPEIIDPKYLELLEKLGFTEIPTAEQVKARLDERRAEIRTAVMEQADARGWCDDGTRQVCADLRLPRPGRRESYTVKVPLTFTVEVRASAFTPESAFAWMQRRLSQASTTSAVARSLGGTAATALTLAGSPVITDANGNTVEIPGGAA